MTEVIIVLVAAFAVIAAATVYGPRLGVAAPLVLVGVGVGASFLPVFAHTHIEPDLILMGVLPPLLYSSAVSMPAMNFRREFGAISGLSVLLVIATSLVLGLFFMLVIPQLGFAWGVALGAIVSPTDAVATSIIKQTSVSKRVVAVLDGESLLNDATALVLLRTAIVATAAAFSFWGALGSFAYSVAIAIAIGWLAGWLNLIIRKHVSDPTVNTVISFAVPFLASLPAELLQASGLVAAVVAGLVTGIRAPRMFSPAVRLSDNQNWRTVELVLEGVVFLTMGVQIREIVINVVEKENDGIVTAIWVALVALALTVLVRAAYVAPLFGVLARRRRRNEQMHERLTTMQERIQTPEGKDAALERFRSSRPGRGSEPRGGRLFGAERQLERFASRVSSMLADIEYFRREQLGWREGTAVVWAGMRGAVTVAAAQTLPGNTPHRAMLVLIAFAVAAASLLIQGGTIGPVLRLVAPKTDPAAAARQQKEEIAAIFELLREHAAAVPGRPDMSGERTPELFAQASRYRLAVIAAQRSALLDARDNGTFDADVLADALANLDAEEIAIALRGKLAGPATAEGVTAGE